MQSFTYKDIIDDKKAEWQDSLRKLEAQAEKANTETKAKISEQIKQLRSAIETAVVQLHALDEKETVDNTIETKDQILKIFGAIDKNFTEYVEKTPFML